MARGRMLNRKISMNRAVAELYNSVGPDGVLFYTWLFAYLDVEGRVHGDPQVLKGLVCPRIAGITPEVIRQTAAKAHELGLIEWYEFEGEAYICFPKFNENQPGLRRKREPPSELPGPTGNLPAMIRQPAGNDPAEIRPKRREWKGREGKRNKSNDPAKSKAVLEIVSAGDETFCVTEEMVDAWRKAFPGIDVIAQLRSANQWQIDNPDKRKTKKGCRRFLGSWMRNAQDRPARSNNGQSHGNEKPPPYHRRLN